MAEVVNLRRLRSLLRIVHSLSSTGWIGAVTAFAVVAGIGWSSPSEEIWMGVYASLRALMWLVIVPLATLSVVSGTLQSVITPWGLVRHYWVLTKIVLSAVAVGALLLHARIGDAAFAAARAGHTDFGTLRLQLVVDAGAAVALLLVISLLGFIKPRGRTPWSDSQSAIDGPAASADLGSSPEAGAVG